MTENAPRELVVPPLARAGLEPDTIAPDGSEIRLLVGEQHRISRVSVCEVTLPAGAASRPVAHRTVEEVWYVLDGHGDVWREAPGPNATRTRPVSVKPGDALTIPQRWRFQFRASTTGPLRFLCVTAPPWPGSDEAEPIVGEGC